MMIDKLCFRKDCFRFSDTTDKMMCVYTNKCEGWQSSRTNKKKKGRTIDPNFYAGEVSTDISKNTIKDDRECKICGKKLSEHSSFSDNHTHISKGVKE